MHSRITEGLPSIPHRTEESKQRKQHVSGSRDTSLWLVLTPWCSLSTLTMHSHCLYQPTPAGLYAELVDGMELWTPFLLPTIYEASAKPYLLRTYFLSFPIERQDIATLGALRSPRYVLSPKGTTLAPVEGTQKCHRSKSPSHSGRIEGP